jgi:hypothetical protein
MRGGAAGRVAQLLAGWLALATVATGEEEDEEGEEGAEWTVTVCYHTGLDCQDESPICIDRTSDDEDGLGTTCSSVQVCPTSWIRTDTPQPANAAQRRKPAQPASQQPGAAQPANRRSQPARADSARR